VPRLAWVEGEEASPVVTGPRTSEESAAARGQAPERSADVDGGERKRGAASLGRENRILWPGVLCAACSSNLAWYQRPGQQLHITDGDAVLLVCARTCGVATCIGNTSSPASISPLIKLLSSTLLSESQIKDSPPPPPDHPVEATALERLLASRRLKMASLNFSHSLLLRLLLPLHTFEPR